MSFNPTGWDSVGDFLQCPLKIYLLLGDASNINRAARVFTVSTHRCRFSPPFHREKSLK